MASANRKQIVLRTLSSLDIVNIFNFFALIFNNFLTFYLNNLAF